MRDYSAVRSTLWTGRTGRAIRGDQEAQLVSAYLITCSHANMIGVFHCPTSYIAHELGMPMAGVLKGVNRLVEVEFCDLDPDLDLIWVRSMARFQVAEQLKPTDKRVKAVAKLYDQIPSPPLKLAFHNAYAAAFLLPLRSPLEGSSKPLGSPLEGIVSPPSKPVTVAGAGKEEASQDTATLTGEGAVGGPDGQAGPALKVVR